MSTMYHQRRVALMKRPPLVRSSSPSTTFINNKPKKSVRFCDNESLENVRLFLKTQMPKACKSDPSYPKQYTYQLRLPNWSTKKNTSMNAVRFENIKLVTENDSNEITLIGTCQVANLAFEKHVVIRYSLDHWTTVKEMDAMYKEPIPNSSNTWDRFSFKIVLNNMHHAHETLYLAIKYNVLGREYWDNNNNKNYLIDIIPQIQLEDDFSSSSSSDEEDDHNYQLNTTTTTNIIQKPWSPPLSPTTPVDENPLWNSIKTKNGFFHHSSNNYHDFIGKYYFNGQQNMYNGSTPKVIQS